MFRRKEDGTDPVDGTLENPALAGQTGDTLSYNAPMAASAPAPAASPAPAPTPVPAPASVATAPAAQPTPSFRPVPPQAAMVAANRNNAPSSTAPAAHPAPSRMQASKRVLTVGPDIQMKGEITTCDRVVIEGMVDATMRDVHTVELAETGSLKGTAEVEDAEISGSFEGDLVVRGKLTVYSSGRVRGNITYGEIEIQRGGQISGNVRNVADAKANAQPAGQGKKAA